MKRDQFRLLHDFCGTLPPKISRKLIIGKIQELTGSGPVRVIKTTLESDKTRGFFLNASNTNHPFVRDHGKHVIVVAHGLNYCWDRFVQVKEAMHLFDDEEEFTDSADDLERLLTEMTSPPAQVQGGGLTELGGSDWLAIWMALTCFCPEKNRMEFQALLAENKIDHYGIALRLRIPAQYVPLLFLPGFTVILKSLRGE